MAVTSIWDIKGRVDKVINYAMNPEKTSENSKELLAAFHAIEGMVEYASNQLKTEKQVYVKGINCDPDVAASQFMKTKMHWGKTDGIIAFHAYQSFLPGEVDAKSAHEIGVRLAEELWGDRFEVVVATHVNTGHYHNHFVLNSVSFIDGLRYYDQKKSYYLMRDVSDRLCREHRLSVIKNPQGRRKNYSEWSAEKNGKPTLRGSIRADVDRAIGASTTMRDFMRVMAEMGYEINLSTKSGGALKYPNLKPLGAKGNFRFHKLGEGYDLDSIKDRILENLRKRIPFPEAGKRYAGNRYFRGTFKSVKKLHGLRALYLHYCYKLKMISKRPASCKRVPISLRQDIIEMDKRFAETRFLVENKIETVAELEARKRQTELNMEQLIAQREVLRRRLRRCDESDATPLKNQISAMSEELKLLRKELQICRSISERSIEIERNIKDIEHQTNAERREVKDFEHGRRRSGTGYTDVAERR